MCSCLNLSFAVEMEIHEHEALELLGETPSIPESGAKKKKKRKANAPLATLPLATEATPTLSDNSLINESIANELVVTKQELERVNREMEGMRSEMDELRRATLTPKKKIFALDVIPSLILAKSNLELLKWVSDVLAVKMREKMKAHQDYFRVIESIAGVDSVGIRTCPVFNRIEFCSVKWHHRTKTTKAGRSRADLRLHCCTLCIEALGIICGHPLLRCPWIFEDTWKKIPGDITTVE
jgi:hypothetical protein